MSRADNLGTLPFSDYADPDPNGQLRIGDEEPRLVVRTMNAGTPRAFERAYLTCPNGHDMGSAPDGSASWHRWAERDFARDWCNGRGCGWAFS